MRYISIILALLFLTIFNSLIVRAQLPPAVAKQIEAVGGRKFTANIHYTYSDQNFANHDKDGNIIYQKHAGNLQIQAVFYMVGGIKFQGGASFDPVNTISCNRGGNFTLQVGDCSDNVSIDNNDQVSFVLTYRSDKQWNVNISANKKGGHQGKNCSADIIAVSGNQDDGMISINEKGACTITYNKSVHKTEHDAEGKSFETYKNIGISVDIQPGEPKQQLEAVIYPVNTGAFENWLPIGPPTDGSSDKGNTIAFKLLVRDKKDTTKIYLFPYGVTWTIGNVSKYPGYCNNYPAFSQSPDIKPDLRFDDSSFKNNPIVKKFTDDELTSRDSLGQALNAVIRCYDYAAWGTLSAKVTLLDGTVIESISYRSHSKNVITIPCDDNNNKIADKWEKDVGIWGKTDDPNFDEDKYPELQKRAGDGYTLFEEYRGFKVTDNVFRDKSHEFYSNGFLRTDPNYKDVFVWDQDGLFMQYYQPYNPADLNWHLVTDKEMVFNKMGKDPDNRWVNFNKVDNYFYARQYAIILRKAPGGSDKITAGQALDYNKLADYDSKEGTDGGVDETPDGIPQALKHTMIVDVYTDAITNMAQNYFKSSSQQSVYQLMMICTVTHEVGHALGIAHHFDESGQQSGQSQVQGVLDCTMRYLSPIEIQKRLVNLRFRYCNTFDTWTSVDLSQPNTDPNQATPIKTITHHSNNCFGEIDVKSDK